MMTPWRVSDTWRARARCGNEDPEKFFPTNGRPSNESRVGCTHCPVREECLQAALESPWEPAGIWGGLTASEIRPMWAQRHNHGSRQAEVHQLLGLL